MRQKIQHHLAPVRAAICMFAAFALLLLWASSPAAAGKAQDWKEQSVLDLIEKLQITKGAVVADVGAGRGDWSLLLASRVAGSWIYAIEIKNSLIEQIEANIASAGVENVIPVLGTESGTGLPDGSCEAALLRHVYHHFSQPESMRRDLFRILKPGGRVAVIDFEPIATSRGPHGASADDVVNAMAAVGFDLVHRVSQWEEIPATERDFYLLVFRRPPKALG